MRIKKFNLNLFVSQYLEMYSMNIEANSYSLPEDNLHRNNVDGLSKNMPITEKTAAKGSLETISIL